MQLAFRGDEKDAIGEHRGGVDGATEDAYSDAIQATGHSLERNRSDGWLVVPQGHEVQYFAPALVDDPIEVVSWLCELGKNCWAWTHEVYNAQTRRLLARDYCPAALVNPEGMPAAAPRQAVEDVLRGP